MDDISREVDGFPRSPRAPARSRPPDEGVDEALVETPERDLFADETSPRFDPSGGAPEPEPDADPDPEADLDPPAAGQEETASAEVAPLTEPAELARVLLALLLASREPISLLRLAQACNTTQQAVQGGLTCLERILRDAGLPLAVSRAGESVRVLSLPEVYPYLERLSGVRKAERLSRAALETLAVVAYRQPVIRAEIEAIRGVKVGPMLRTLLEHKLVAVLGRADVPGRPLQYGTTAAFLDRFGLASLKDLPSVKEFKALD